MPHLDYRVITGVIMVYIVMAIGIKIFIETYLP